MARHQLTPAAYLLLEREGKLLVARRQNTGFADGWWSVPAGRIEPGETALACALREGKEELGLELDPSALRVCGLLQRQGGDHERIDVYFHGQLAEAPRNAEPEKCAELRFVDRAELPQPMLEFVVYAIARLDEPLWFASYGYARPLSSPGERRGPELELEAVLASLVEAPDDQRNWKRARDLLGRA